MATNYKEQIIFDGPDVEVHGYDQRAKHEFFDKVGSLVQVVPKGKYNELFDDMLVGGYASFRAKIIRAYMSDTPEQIFKVLKSPVIAINADRFPKDEYIQAAIQHELAELWILSKLGFSTYALYQHDIMSKDRAVNLSHLHARMHEYQFAQNNGFLDEYVAWQRKVNFFGQTINTRIYDAVVRRAKRE